MLRLFIVVLIAGFGYKFYSFFHRGGMEQEAIIVLVLFGALLGRTAAPWLLDIFPALRDLARRSVHEKWQGKYYSFGVHQLRFYLVGPTIWTAADDLAKVLEPPPSEREWRLLAHDYGTIPFQGKLLGCTEAGLAQLLRARTTHRRASHEMIRFKSWLETEAYPNLKKNPASSA
jgi:hypothetical protein